MTQKDIIVNYLKSQKDWVYGYKLIGIETPFGFLGSSGDRRARELAEEGAIERRIMGKFVQYREKKELKAIDIWGNESDIKP